MEAMLAASVAVLAAAAGLVAWRVSRRAAREGDLAWREAAESLGLELRRARGGSRWLHGRVGDRVVDVAESEGKAATRLVVRGERIPAGLALKAERRETGIKKAIRGAGFQVGDPLFDSKVSVAGPEAEALAVLGAAARAAAVQFFDLWPGAAIQKGKVELEVDRAAARRSGFLVAIVGSMLELARLLSLESVSASLAGHARTDPSPAVRARNLAQLLAALPEGAPAQEALASGLADQSLQVRLEAASRAGERGFAILAGQVDDAAAPPEVRAEALRRLAAAFPYPRVAEHVARALESEDDEVLRSAVSAAAAGRDASALERLAALASTPRLQLATAVARALGELADPRAEPSLIALLGHRSLHARRAAVGGLAALGSARAVEPLLALVDGAPGGLKEAARRAVRRIQGRLGDAAAGRLSVAPVDAALGGLSMGEEGGALSLEDDGEDLEDEGEASG